MIITEEWVHHRAEEMLHKCTAGTIVNLTASDVAKKLREAYLKAGHIVVPESRLEEVRGTFGNLDFSAMSPSDTTYQKTIPLGITEEA